MERSSDPPSVSNTQTKLVVFDFDLTILSIHSWGERVRPEDVASRSLEDDVADLEFFRVFVERALASGIKVAIASFGVYEVIQAYMDRAVGPGVFTRANISTPSQHGTKDGHVVRGGKVPQLVVRERSRRARHAARDLSPTYHRHLPRAPRRDDQRSRRPTLTLPSTSSNRTGSPQSLSSRLLQVPPEEVSSVADAVVFFDDSRCVSFGRHARPLSLFSKRLAAVRVERRRGAHSSRNL